MNLSHNAWCLFLLSLSAGLSARSRHKDFSLHKHLVDGQIARIVDEHAQELSRLVKKIHTTLHRKHGVWKFDWLPGYYVKYNTIRVVKRELVSQTIEKYNLSLMHTPKKYLYHIKGRPHNLHSLNYIVIIKEVPEDLDRAEQPLTLEHVEQLITLIEKSGYCSTFSHNFIRRSDNRLSLIDMDGTFSKKGHIKGLIGLLFPDLNTYYTSEALEYILDKIAQRMGQMRKHERRATNEIVSRILKKNNQFQERAIRKRIKWLIQQYV